MRSAMLAAERAEVDGGSPHGLPLIGAAEHPEDLGTIRLALAAYTLMAWAFKALNAEGEAVWVAYSGPHSIRSVLWQPSRSRWQAIKSAGGRP